MVNEICSGVTLVYSEYITVPATAFTVFAHASKRSLRLCVVAQTCKPRQSGLLRELRVSDSPQSMYQETDNEWIQFPSDLTNTFAYKQASHVYAIRDISRMKRGESAKVRKPCMHQYMLRPHSSTAPAGLRYPPLPSRA